MAGIDDVFLRRTDVLRLLDVNPATLWRWRKAGGFPSPITLTSRNLRWRKADLDAWLESRRVVEGGGHDRSA
ncbi:helix-turn-helix transcriptional regulator [Pseudorhodobacter sp. W20_MBD10_FR17]|uniref:helix-turn-helix transcriptional regulator n=1 Tax=Pseudorhodobacter sp. W20_MBD10_FR17 TaxID=3240266 RepID=UPI003F987DF3